MSETEVSPPAIAEVNASTDLDTGGKYTKIINLTNHKLTEILSGIQIDFSESGVARVDCRDEIIYRDPSGYTISRTKYVHIVGIDLDNINPNHLYIVSAVVLNAIRERGLQFDNIVAPAKIIRDSDNNVIAARGFRVNG
jgi:hypothetical protein